MDGKDKGAVGQRHKVAQGVTTRSQAEREKRPTPPLKVPKGSKEVIEKVGDVDYKIEVGRKVKIFHANLLKKYYERELEKMESEVSKLAGIAVIEEEEIGEIGVIDDEHLLELDYAERTGKESYLDVDISEGLTPEQRKEVQEFLQKYRFRIEDIKWKDDVGADYLSRVTSSKGTESSSVRVELQGAQVEDSGVK